LRKTCATISKENKSSSTEIHPVVFDGKPTRPLETMRARFPYKLIDPYTIERTHNRNGRISVDTEQVSGSKLFQKLKHSSIIG